MSAGDMAEFMGHHALHFIGAIRRLDQAGVEKHPLSARDEGVDLIVVDQHDLDLFGIQFGYRHQRRHHVGKQRFGLGIAQDRLGRDRLDGDRDDHQQCRDEAGQPAKRWQINAGR